MVCDVTDNTYYMSSKGKIPAEWTVPEVPLSSSYYTVTSCIDGILYIGIVFYHNFSIQSDVQSYECVLYEMWSIEHIAIYKPYAFEKFNTTQVS